MLMIITMQTTLIIVAMRISLTMSGDARRDICNRTMLGCLAVCAPPGFEKTGFTTSGLSRPKGCLS